MEPAPRPRPARIEVPETAANGQAPLSLELLRGEGGEWHVRAAGPFLILNMLRDGSQKKRWPGLLSAMKAAGLTRLVLTGSRTQLAAERLQLAIDGRTGQRELLVPYQTPSYEE